MFVQATNTSISIGTSKKSIALLQLQALSEETITKLTCCNFMNTHCTLYIIFTNSLQTSSVFSSLKFQPLRGVRECSKLVARNINLCFHCCCDFVQKSAYDLLAVKPTLVFCICMYESYVFINSMGFGAGLQKLFKP